MLMRDNSSRPDFSNNVLFLLCFLDYESFFHATFPVHVNSENYLGSEGLR